MTTPTDTHINITTGVSIAGDPFVQLLIHVADWSATIRPDEARQIAHSLLAAAEAAEGDAFFVRFFRGIQLSDQTIARFLSDYRATRAIDP